ncbi:MAG TPA: hypothetical protein VFD59_20625 [Nocardioidaceae bacterium]|nr:hypothetical protein [Nocardioidaceae bacterium]
MSSDDGTEQSDRPGSRRRLVWAVGVAVSAVATAALFNSGAIPTHADGQARSGPDVLKQQNRSAAEAALVAARADSTRTSGAQHDHRGHSHLAADLPAQSSDAHTHDHSDDPRTKNALSRVTGSALTPETTDPTTARQAAQARDAVAAQRAEPDPKIIPVAKPAARRNVPQNRYAMAGGCYSLQLADSGLWVTRNDDGYSADKERRANAERFHFQATDLGKYLLFDAQEEFIARTSGPLADGEVESAEQAGPSSDWTVNRRGTSYLFRLRNTGNALGTNEAGDLATAQSGERFNLRRTTGCAKWPEVAVNVAGRPFRGTSNIQEVRGYLDAHTHGMAFEFLGGEVHCGRPWHKYGVTAALVDCEDHQLDGSGAVLENVLRTGSPIGMHDPVGWPTFVDWPAPDSLTHEGTYYKWMERAWRGGQRLFVNLLVENGKLCQVYPLKKPSHATCDEMDSIRRQAEDMRDFERYIDAQAGGPGKGWYRIVTNPFQARRAINQGKMAVVMGIETSVVFGCTTKPTGPDPSCTKASITAQLDEVHDLGVRQMELVNKFDNALSGVAGDEGTTGVAVNGANFAETLSFWDMRTCPSSYAPQVRDKNQLTAPGGEQAFSQRDGIFGAIQDLFEPPVAAPTYGPTPHCNEAGLSRLGRHTIRGMADRRMIFDPDHMSVRGRKASLNLVESLDYAGVISSHSWATPDAYPRIYKLGGMVTPYAGDSTGFAAKWQRHLRWADPRYYFGFGFGADINGLGAQGDPRGAGVPNPVRYPFRGLGGVSIGKQHSGERVYDINVDGVAHYGLYPDWIQDLRRIAGKTIVQDMARGPEAYLQMWERAVGVGNDGCRQRSARKPAGVLRNLRPGASVQQVLRAAGQPHARLGDAFTYCAKTGSGATTRLRAFFNGSGQLTRVS